MPKLLSIPVKIIQVILYVPIQIVFVPFAIVGLIVGLYKGMVRSKKLGVSFTAIQSLQYRWMMHYFDTRSDPLSVAFIKAFPCESHFGLWSTMGALIISQRLFGFTTKLGKLTEPGAETLVSTPGRRLLLFDSIMEKYVDEMEQIVIPGVGFDLVALRYTKGKRAKVFEVDQVETLKVKVETLRKTGIEHDWITYVLVDYESESWIEKLEAAGFDRTRKTLFLWQSVSLFLEGDVVKQTLREMAASCAVGSIVAQDLYSRSFISGETSKMIERTSRTVAKRGEPWIFGLDLSTNPDSTVESFLKECGLKMTEIHQFGEKLDVEPFYCIVEAEKL